MCLKIAYFAVFFYFVNPLKKILAPKWLLNPIGPTVQKRAFLALAVGFKVITQNAAG